MKPRDAIEVLRAADARIRALAVTRATLATDRPEASSFESLGHALLDAREPARNEALSSGLEAIVEAQVTHFPETIFWDFDFLAVSLRRLEDAEVIGATCDEIARLHAQYGRDSVIRFRYVHDFTYGFDWAKWVLRAPGKRQHVGPFDPVFIAYLRQRGEELAALIAADDEKYPKLPDGRPRNPFGFSREPRDEYRLCIELAKRGHVPVQTWRTDAQPVWDLSYASLREEVACELGVATRTGGT